jgi:hypothetical protein
LLFDYEKFHHKYQYIVNKICRGAVENDVVEVMVGPNFRKLCGVSYYRAGGADAKRRSWKKEHG